MYPVVWFWESCKKIPCISLTHFHMLFCGNIHGVLWHILYQSGYVGMYIGVANFCTHSTCFQDIFHKITHLSLWILHICIFITRMWNCTRYWMNMRLGTHSSLRGILIAKRESRHETKGRIYNFIVLCAGPRERQQCNYCAIIVQEFVAESCHIS